MTAPTLRQHSQRPPAASPVPRVLRVQAADPGVLMPVLTVLRRRSCRITAVSFRAEDAHGPGHLRIEVEPPARHAHCLTHWVGNVVGVLGVDVTG